MFKHFSFDLPIVLYSTCKFVLSTTISQIKEYGIINNFFLDYLFLRNYNKFKFKIM